MRFPLRVRNCLLKLVCRRVDLMILRKKLDIPLCYKIGRNKSKVMAHCRQKRWVALMPIIDRIDTHLETWNLAPGSWKVGNVNMKYQKYTVYISLFLCVRHAGTPIFMSCFITETLLCLNIALHLLKNSYCYDNCKEL